MQRLGRVDGRPLTAVCGVMTHEEAVGMVCQLSGFKPAWRQDRRGPGHRHGAPANREWSSIPAATLTSAPPARRTRPITSICHEPRRPRPPTAGNPPVGAACARPPGQTHQRQPHRHDPWLHQRGHQIWARRGRRPIRQPAQPVLCIPAQPTVHRLPRHPIAPGHLGDRDAFPGHFQHRPVPLLHRTQLRQHTRLPPPRPPMDRSEEASTPENR